MTATSAVFDAVGAIRDVDDSGCIGPSLSFGSGDFSVLDHEQDESSIAAALSRHHVSHLNLNDTWTILPVIALLVFIPMVVWEALARLPA